MRRIYAFTWSYAAAGNRHYQNRLGQESYFVHNAGNPLTRQYDKTADQTTYYGYDRSGNCTRILAPDGATYFACNSRDLMTRATRFPPPPTREQIDAVERLLGIPLPAELRCFCEEFRCDALDRECYLQYAPASLTGLTQKARGNGGWVNPVLRTTGSRDMEWI